jgi:outer membrane autotransporter protein
MEAINGGDLTSSTATPLDDSLLNALDFIRTAVPASSRELAFKQLIGESFLNVTKAVFEVALKSQSVVFERLDKIHSHSFFPAPSAGDAEDMLGFWAAGFGTWARQSDTNDVHGYKFQSTGVEIGYDRQIASVEGLVFGVSAAFSFGKLDSNDGMTSMDIDAFGLGLYGSYTMRNGFFADASFAFSSSKNKSQVNLVGGGMKTGAYDITTFQLGTRFGVHFDVSRYVITPSVGLRFYNFRQEDWEERSVGTVYPVNFFRRTTDNLVEIPFQLEINTFIEGDTFRLIPEFRVGVTFVAVRPDNAITVGFSGYGGVTELKGVKVPRTSFQSGLGLKLQTETGFGGFVNYDFNGSSHYIEHKAALGLVYEY